MMKTKFCTFLITIIKTNLKTINYDVTLNFHRVFILKKNAFHSVSPMQKVWVHWGFFMLKIKDILSKFMM